MKHIFVVLPVLLFFCLQTTAFAAGSAADLKTIEEVERIRQLPDDQERLAAHLEPLMKNWAGAVSGNSGDFRGHFLLARAYERLGMEDMAGDEDRAADLAGGPVFGAFALLALKQKLFVCDFAGARRYYAFAAKYFPDDGSVAIVRAFDLLAAGKSDQAEKILQAQLNSRQNEFGVNTVLGSLRAENGRFLEAVRLFDRDLSVLPDYKPALLGKAFVLKQLGHYRSSLAIIVPFYLADPYRKNIAGLVSDAFCGLGLYKEALRPAIVSLAVARQEQEMQQAKERIWLIWPRVSASERKSEGEGIASVLDSTVWAARLHFALGDALQKSGFIPEAENQFWRGLKIQPDHDRAYLHLGEIYQNNYHKKTTAVLFYMKYLRYADDPVIKARLMRLSSEFARKRDIALRMKNYINKGT